MRFHLGIREAQQDSSSSSSTSSTSSDSSSSTGRATETINQWTNSEETGKYLSPVISIQRAWRSYRNTRQTRPLPSLVELNSPSDAGQWEKDETSETDSSSSTGVQMMSLSTPEDSEQNLKIDDDLPSIEDPEALDPNETIVLDKRSYNVSYSLAMRCGIDSDPESIVSDYSEMADPIKEHLANVQIIQKEDLDLGNTFIDNFLVQPKLFRGSEEDEEEFNKRLRKTNYLSLAQEFAELKKVNASALPFGLHKEKYQTVSPLSDPESGSDLDCSDPGGGNLGDSSEALSSTENNHVLGNGATDCAKGLEASETKKGDELLVSETSAKLENADMKTKPVNPVSNPLINSSSSTRNEGAVPHKQEVPDVDASNGFYGVAASVVAPGAGRGDSVPPSLEQSECIHVPESPGKGKFVRRKMEESVGEFDIYTVETALPQMDWQLLEEQLQRAAEEEQKKWSHCGDREQIRRKLAMPVEDDSFDSDLLLRKPSLQSRLQTNMNLHMCFVNEAAASEVTTVTRGRSVGDLAASVTSSTPDVVPVQSHREFLKVGAVVDQDDNEDFFTKQARLQAEAKMALAQVRPMAHMQLQLEKQLKKKSPLAEIVGIPGFIDGKFRHLSKHLLLQMNFAQLQVVVNDLHAQIEVLNSELMQQLVDRDDLHMAQDSMLVDIEDLTGRAQEFAARVNKRAVKKEFLK